MEVKIAVFAPIVVVLSVLLIAVIMILCYYFLWPFYRRSRNSKAKYSKLIDDDVANRRRFSKSSIVQRPSPPLLQINKTEQTWRSHTQSSLMTSNLNNKFVTSPPDHNQNQFDFNSLKTKENNNKKKSPNTGKDDKSLLLYNAKFSPPDRRLTICEDDVFHYDEISNSSSSVHDCDVNGSDSGSVQNIENDHVFHNNNNKDKKVKKSRYRLSSDMKSRYRSEPILSRLDDEDPIEKDTHISSKGKQKRFSGTITRKRSRALSVIAPAGGQLEFSLYYDGSEKSLTVNLIQLLNIDLKPECFVGVLDVLDQNKKRREKSVNSVHLIRKNDNTLQLSEYPETGFLLCLSLLPKQNYRRRTEVVFGKQSAVFNEKFKVTGDVMENIASSFLCVHALCKFGRDGEPIVLGECKIPLKRLQNLQILPFMGNLTCPSEELVLESSLKPTTDLGGLEIYLSFNPIAQSLVVKIIQASGLPRIGMTGSPNVSVKVSLYYCNSRVEKKTTSIQKRQRDPIFNETFEFQLSKDRISECDVLFEIRHHGPMYRSVIGYVIVGNSAGGEGTKQWRQLLDFTCHEKLYKIMPKKPVGMN